MSALIISIAIGSILSHNSGLLSWVMGAILLVITIVLAFMIVGTSSETIIAASLSIFGFNLGLMTVFTQTFQTSTPAKL